MARVVRCPFVEPIDNEQQSAVLKGLFRSVARLWADSFCSSQAFRDEADRGATHRFGPRLSAPRSGTGARPVGIRPNAPRQSSIAALLSANRGPRYLSRALFPAPGSPMMTCSRSVPTHWSAGRRSTDAAGWALWEVPNALGTDQLYSSGSSAFHSWAVPILPLGTRGLTYHFGFDGYVIRISRSLMRHGSEVGGHKTIQ